MLNKQEKLMNTIIQLTAGQQIKTPYDEYQPVIEIGTSKNFSKNGTHIGPEGTWLDESIPFHLEGWKIWEANCGRNWKTQYLWANRRAACLTADYPGKAAEMEAKRQAYEDAVMVDDGDIVEVDGMKFEVFVIKRVVSDQVKFTLID
jgi:hypothetical protein